METGDGRPEVLGEDSTFSRNNLNAVSFSLRPAGDNRHGFPVHVFINGLLEPMVIEDSATYAPGFLITSLRVDAKPGGGWKGEKWYLTLEDNAAAQRAPRSPTAPNGNLITVPQGATELLVWDSYINTAPFIDVDAIASSPGAWDGGRRYLLPDARMGGYTNKPANNQPPGVWNTQMGAPSTEVNWAVFDVSRFEHCCLAWRMNGLKDTVVETQYQTVPEWLVSLSFWLEVSLSPYGPADHILPMGTTNNFGASGLGATPYATGYVLTGARSTQAGAHYNEEARHFPYVRPSLLMNGKFDINGLPVGRDAVVVGWKARISLIAW